MFINLSHLQGFVFLLVHSYPWPESEQSGRVELCVKCWGYTFVSPGVLPAKWLTLNCSPHGWWSTAGPLSTTPQPSCAGFLSLALWEPLKQRTKHPGRPNTFLWEMPQPTGKESPQISAQITPKLTEIWCLITIRRGKNNSCFLAYLVIQDASLCHFKNTEITKYIRMYMYICNCGNVFVWLYETSPCVAVWRHRGSTAEGYSLPTTPGSFPMPPEA